MVRGRASLKPVLCILIYRLVYSLNWSVSHKRVEHGVENIIKPTRRSLLFLKRYRRHFKRGSTKLQIVTQKLL